MEYVSLGHNYQTDVLELVIRSAAVIGMDDAGWWSLLYALIEGAAEKLEIARDDIDGTLFHTDFGQSALMLFDSVPGGAGHVRHIAEHLRDVLDQALSRVAHCECGKETSCYRCLRVFRNERRHDQLRRGIAADILSRLVGRTTTSKARVLRVSLSDLIAGRAPDRRFLVREVPGEVFEPAAAGQLDLHEGRVMLARYGDSIVVGRLWLRRDEAGIDQVKVYPVKGDPLQLAPADLQPLGIAV
ncbi:MAG: DUF1998 domain-containing protein [Micromonosporaceae bacterium]|nr:DUF1998 domain-containing protein [Micromonosporaceae bacterium]